MSREYSTDQLERMVVGNPENPNVQFFERSRMNPEKSREEGRRVYETVIMIKKTHPGLPDFASYVAQPKDIREYPDEYRYFQNTKADIGSPGIEVLPGLTQDEIQELRDYGLNTITRLCGAKTLPEHLLHCKESAIRVNEVFKHEQEKNQQEGRKQEETSDVPTDGGCVDTSDVGRSNTDTSQTARNQSNPQRLHQSGRVHSGESVATDWSISFQ